MGGRQLPVAQDGGWQEQADKQGQEGWQEESVSAHSLRWSCCLALRWNGLRKFVDFAEPIRLPRRTGTMSRRLALSLAALLERRWSPGHRAPRCSSLHLPFAFKGSMSLWGCSHNINRASGSGLTYLLCAQIASDGLKGRVFEVSLADLQSVRSCRVLASVFAPASNLMRSLVAPASLQQVGLHS